MRVVITIQITGVKKEKAKARTRTIAKSITRTGPKEQEQEREQIADGIVLALGRCLLFAR